MADSYDRYDNEGSGGGFMMGLLTGTVLGAGLGMLLAPKAGSEMRGALGEQARNLGSMASEGYRRASEQAGGWAEKGTRYRRQGEGCRVTRRRRRPRLCGGDHRQQL
jgi:gas vesicle protein